MVGGMATNSLAVFETPTGEQMFVTTTATKLLKGVELVMFAVKFARRPYCTGSPFRYHRYLSPPPLASTVNFAASPQHLLVKLDGPVAATSVLTKTPALAWRVPQA